MNPRSQRSSTSGGASDCVDMTTMNPCTPFFWRMDWYSSWLIQDGRSNGRSGSRRRRGNRRRLSEFVELTLTLVRLVESDNTAPPAGARLVVADAGESFVRPESRRRPVGFRAARRAVGGKQFAKRHDNVRAEINEVLQGQRAGLVVPINTAGKFAARKLDGRPGGSNILISPC